MIYKFIHMNRFMYLSKRKFSTQGIKLLYPKCVNCINFKNENQTCKRFVLTENYINYDSNNEPAVNVRNDNTKCGESGKLFDIGKEKLEKDNLEVLNIFFKWTLATGVLTLVTQNFMVIFIPATISFLTGVVYFVDCYNCNERINTEKKRIESLKQFQK